VGSVLIYSEAQRFTNVWVCLRGVEVQLEGAASSICPLPYGFIRTLAEQEKQWIPSYRDTETVRKWQSVPWSAVSAGIEALEKAGDHGAARLLRSMVEQEEVQATVQAIKEGSR
jgi:hypothetical protein